MRTHITIRKKPSGKASRDYKLSAEWSEEDQAFIGYAPELFEGGVCHHENRIACYAELLEIVEWSLANDRELKATLVTTRKTIGKSKAVKVARVPKSGHTISR